MRGRLHLGLQMRDLDLQRAESTASGRATVTSLSPDAMANSAPMAALGDLVRSCVRDLMRARENIAARLEA